MKRFLSFLFIIFLLSSNILDVKGYSEGSSSPQTVTWKYSTENVTGLVGYWKFNEGTGTNTSDSSGNGNHGTVYGASWVDGKYGKALSFDGTNYIDVEAGSSLDFTTEMTICFWMKAPTPVTDSFMINKGWKSGELGTEHPFKIQWISGGTPRRIYLTVADATPILYDVLSTTQLSADEWHFVVVRKTSSIIDMWLDGIFEDSTVMTNDMGTNTQSVWIGGRNANGALQNPFDGLLDEVRVYSRALNSTEITRLYGFNNILGTVTNGNSSSSAYYWDYGDKQTFKYDFSYAFPEDGLQKSLNCTYPKTQSFVNVSYYPYSTKLVSGQYVLSVYNSTHNKIRITDSTLSLYGNNYRMFTEVVAPTIIGLDIVNLILILITVVCGFLAIVIPLIGFGGIVIGLINIIGLDTSDQFFMIIWAVTLILCVGFTLYGLEINKK